jgi:hypothetical protein
VCELRECRLVVPQQRPRLLTLRLRTKHTRLSGQSHEDRVTRFTQNELNTGECSWPYRRAGYGLRV